jgi:hypothetical protein
MLIDAYITQADAIRAGAEDYGKITIDVNLGELSDEQRENLARVVEGEASDHLLHEGALRVKHPTVLGLLDTLREITPVDARERELDELSPLPASVPRRDRVRAARDLLFEPLDGFARYEPARDVEHTPSCANPKATFRVEALRPTEEQSQELQRMLRAARSIEGRVNVAAKLHRGLCPSCGGWAELYGAVVEVTTPGGNHFSRELALQPPK